MDIATLASATDPVIMAQFVDTGGLEGLIDEFGGAIQLVGTIIIGVVAAVFAFPPLIRGLKNVGGKKMNEGIADIGKAALVIIIAMIGVGGLFAVVESINPAESQSGVTEYLES